MAPAIQRGYITYDSFCIAWKKLIVINEILEAKK